MKKTIISLLLCVAASLAFFPFRAHALSCPECGGDMVEKVVEAPDCTHGGHSYYQCVSCGYGMRGATPALGHDYQAEVLQGADCLNGGRIRYTCSRCQASYEQATAALGHNFKTETTEPDCENDGELLQTCTRCGLTLSEILPATGHSFEITEAAPTCEKDGERRQVCSVCGKTEIQHFPALGHDYHYTVTEATCTQAGQKQGECSRCGHLTTELLPAAGHLFGPWTVTKEPTVFAEGEQQRQCTVCSYTEKQAIPKKSPLPILLITGILGGGGAVFLITRSHAAAKAASRPGMITLQLKHVLSLLSSAPENRAFEKYLKKKKFIDLKKPQQISADPDPEKGRKYQPDLILLEASSADELRSALAAAKEKYGEANYGVLAADSLSRAVLEAAVKDKSVFAWAYRSHDEKRRLVRLIMPLYKPSQATGNYAENATLITDALGLPLISAILNTYVVGGDIKEAIEKRGMSKADTADLINDIAGLFGLEALSVITERIRIGSDQSQRRKDNRETDDRRE